MKQSSLRRRLPQLLLLGLLLLVQVGLFVHQFEHVLGDGGTHCALCVAADHIGHAPIPAIVFVAAVACIYLLLTLTKITLLLPHRAHVLRGARAPPRFSSRQ